MTEIKHFFIGENTIDYIPDEAYDNINHIIEDIEAFSHTTYKSMYVIDYFRQDFLYVSDNPLFLCGMTPDEVRVMGYNFYISQVPPEDLDLLLEINTAGFQFLQDIPTGELRDYTISYDFHIINRQSKKKWLIHHQITPLRLTEKGQVWLALCAASISSAAKSGNIEMSKNKTKDLWVYNRGTKKWKQKKHPELKEVEMDVLKLSAMGYTMQEIADEVNRSFDSVKVYRKSLLEKLGVENIVEAINYAKNRKII
ncbi:transcriptional regulator, LuxR family [Bacteroides pyogenes F0041]|uniref:Transcriptional regulator, LuxR family n=1 Tax=Bacteroides pyogenes F0041 TaxID=1321819 RepID=U2E3R3_9BACE|nr:helix-turn-helix transcriptional regulator [Bacteroides pyogenes]ERI88797.1 transcriptional regulator, LuxR family [Bacteroides pyogenes F0041]MBB3896265.1 DNA-binding CsgD family transcriptional regulator [Bacteroides pyogenes]SUV31300.1 LuxR family transcriptional regulator [Bacteroides pyogenes]